MAAKETGEDILKHLQKEGSSKVQAQVAAELAKIQGEKPKPKSKKTSTPKTSKEDPLEEKTSNPRNGSDAVKKQLKEDVLSFVFPGMYGAYKKYRDIKNKNTDKEEQKDQEEKRDKIVNRSKKDLSNDILKENNALIRQQLGGQQRSLMILQQISSKLDRLGSNSGFNFGLPSGLTKKLGRVGAGIASFAAEAALPAALTAGALYGLYSVSKQIKEDPEFKNLESKNEGKTDSDLQREAIGDIGSRFSGRKPAAVDKGNLYNGTHSNFLDSIGAGPAALAPDSANTNTTGPQKQTPAVSTLSTQKKPESKDTLSFEAKNIEFVSDKLNFDVDSIVIKSQDGTSQQVGAPNAQANPSSPSGSQQAQTPETPQQPSSPAAPHASEPVTPAPPAGPSPAAPETPKTSSGDANDAPVKPTQKPVAPAAPPAPETPIDKSAENADISSAVNAQGRKMGRGSGAGAGRGSVVEEPGARTETPKTSSGDANDPVTTSSAATHDRSRTSIANKRPSRSSVMDQFKGDYQSNGKPLINPNGTVNWGDPNAPADFVRASKAQQALQAAPANRPSVTSIQKTKPEKSVPLPPTRPKELTPLPNSGEESLTPDDINKTNALSISQDQAGQDAQSSASGAKSFRESLEARVNAIRADPTSELNDEAKKPVVSDALSTSQDQAGQDAQESAKSAKSFRESIEARVNAMRADPTSELNDEAKKPVVPEPVAPQWTPEATEAMLNRPQVSSDDAIMQALTGGISTPAAKLEQNAPRIIPPPAMPTPASTIISPSATSSASTNGGLRSDSTGIGNEYNPKTKKPGTELQDSAHNKFFEYLFGSKKKGLNKI